jgi:hypothetical protein
VERDRKRLHNEELHNLYVTPNIARVMKSGSKRWAGHVARMEEMRNACKILVGKPKGNRPFRRSKFKWEGNIRMDLKEKDFVTSRTGFIWLGIGSSGGIL